MAKGRGASLGRQRDPNPTPTFTLPFGNSQSNSASPRAGPSEQTAAGSQNSPPPSQRQGSEEIDSATEYWKDGDVDFLDEVDEDGDRSALGTLCHDWGLNVHGKRAVAELHRRILLPSTGLGTGDPGEPVSKKTMLSCALIHSAQLERGIARIEDKVDKIASLLPAAGTDSRSVTARPAPAPPSLTTTLSKESEINTKSMVGRVFLHPEFCGYDDNTIIWETVLKMLKKRPEQLGPNIDCLNSNNTSAHKVLKAFVSDKASKLRFHLKELHSPTGQLADHLNEAIPLKDFCEKLFSPYHIQPSTAKARRICLLRRMAADPKAPVRVEVTLPSGEKDYDWNRTWFTLVDQQIVALLEQKKSGREGKDQVNIMFRNLLEEDLAASGDDMSNWDNLPETLDESEVAVELI
ncbi:hypothetical protein P7C70_g3649, partial [Phenoliferia sp. Uapishka_3]